MTNQKHIDFFYEHAGYSYFPGRETPEQGRLRCARELAEAEDVFLTAYRYGIASIRWEEDADDLVEAQKEGVERTEYACIYIDDDCVASLSAIWDASDEYKRVIRAELALECIKELMEAIAND